MMGQVDGQAAVIFQGDLPGDINLNKFSVSRMARHVNTSPFVSDSLVVNKNMKMMKLRQDTGCLFLTNSVIQKPASLSLEFSSNIPIIANLSLDMANQKVSQEILQQCSMITTEAAQTAATEIEISC